MKLTIEVKQDKNNFYLRMIQSSGKIKRENCTIKDLINNMWTAIFKGDKTTAKEDKHGFFVFPIEELNKLQTKENPK